MLQYSASYLPLTSVHATGLAISSKHHYYADEALRYRRTTNPLCDIQLSSLEWAGGKWQTLTAAQSEWQNRVYVRALIGNVWAVYTRERDDLWAAHPMCKYILLSV